MRRPGDASAWASRRGEREREKLHMQVTLDTAPRGHHTPANVGSWSSNTSICQLALLQLTKPLALGWRGLRVVSQN